MKIKTVMFYCAIVFYTVCFAQLDTVHFISPLHSRDDAQIVDHFVYLSTPVTTPFTVTITDGAGNVLATPTISNASPAKWIIGNGQLSGSRTFVPKDSLNKVLKTSGLILSAPQKFYTNLRVRSGSQADCLTTKGRAAAGTTFRVGGLPMSLAGQQSSWDFSAGIMATANNTTVTITGYDTAVVFAGTSTITFDSLTFTLNRGECYVLAGYTNVSANLRGFVGALVQADNPIVLDNGNLLGNITNLGVAGQDIGIDQSVPITKIGQQYILIEGNGSAATEIPVVIAHYDSTAVFVNGNAVPDTVINAGRFYMVPNANYQGTCNKNMHIRTSHPAYVYQCLAGASTNQTGALNFIPPYGCWLQDTINNIPAVDSIGTTTYSGGVMVFTEAGATLKINGVVQTCAEPVLSVPWETYKILGLTGNVAVTSTGIVAAGIFGYNGAAGYAGYYAGFSEIPFISVGHDTSVCVGTAVQLNLATTATGTYSWLPTAGLDNPAIANPVATPSVTTKYIATVIAANGCNISDSLIITVDSPVVVTVTTQPASCFGNNDGSAAATVSGGTLPYTYAWSSSGGTNPIATGLAAGTYTIIVTGTGACGANAQNVTVTEPAQITVSINSDKSVMCSGDSAQICVTTGFTSYLWNTGNTAQCVNTKLAGNYYVTVTDNTGCTAESNHLAITVHSPPPVAISVNGDTLNAYNAINYQWYLNGNAITGATDSVYIANQGGSYTVAVTDTNGCFATSNAIVVTGVNEIGNSAIRISPNPFTDEINISLTGTGGNILLTDITGRKVAAVQLETLNYKLKTDFLSTGIYFLQITTGNERRVKQMVKQ